MCHEQEASLTSLELKQVTEKYNTLINQSGNVVELMAECDRPPGGKRPSERRDGTPSTRNPTP